HQPASRGALIIPAHAGERGDPAATYTTPWDMIHRALHSTDQQPENSPYDRTLYRQRHKVENTFAKLKDWRRIATRYDRCAHTFFSAICIAATMIFWL
ncbi:hypothetical protein CN121_29185, partial [Sinorhizobium meliloti]